VFEGGQLEADNCEPYPIEEGKRLVGSLRVVKCQG